MFSLKNIKKLFKYDWKTLIKKVLPNGNSGNFTSEEQDTLCKSSIIGIIASAVVIVSVVGVIIETFSSIYGSFIKLGFFDMISFGELLWEIIKYAFVPATILVYTKLRGKENQNSWIVFAMLIVILIWTLYATYTGLSYIRAISFAPIFTIVGLAGAFLSLLAGGNIVTVCLDFSDRVNEIKTTTTVSTSTGYTMPNQSSNEQSNVEQVQQATKFCSNCGNQVPSNSEFCSKCGNKLS